MICRAGRTDSRSFNAGVRERSVSQGCDPPLLSNSPRRLFDGESSGRWGNRVRDSEQRQEEPRASLSLLKRHSFFPRTCLGPASRNPWHARIRGGLVASCRARCSAAGRLLLALASSQALSPRSLRPRCRLHQAAVMQLRSWRAQSHSL